MAIWYWMLASGPIPDLKISELRAKLNFGPKFGDVQVLDKVMDCPSGPTYISIPFLSILLNKTLSTSTRSCLRIMC